jgi:hypothetical protein
MSDRANERRKGSGRLHGRPLDENGSIEFTKPTAPVDAPPSDTSLLCADCKHPKNDSRFHLEAPGDNWGAALHHFVPAAPPQDVKAAIERAKEWASKHANDGGGTYLAMLPDDILLICAAAERPAPAQEDLERARKLVYEMGICSTSGHMARMIAKEYAADCAFRRAAPAERQVAGAGKFTVTFRPYPAGAGSRVHDESWTIEGNSLRDALDKFYCKPEFNSEWRVVDVALPAERVSAEELAKAILDVVERMRKEAECVLRPPEMNNAKTWASPLLFWAGEMESKLATLRPTHTPESGD